MLGSKLVLSAAGAGGAVSDYWVATLGSTSTENGLSVAVDSSDNIYLSGYARTGSVPSDLLIAKYDSTGNIQWQRVLENTNSNERGLCVSLDGLGGVYVSGAPTGIYGYAKYDTSGNVSHERKLGTTSTAGRADGCVADSSGNIYLAGFSINSGLWGQFTKYDSSGTLQWQRRFGTASDSQLFYGAALDGSSLYFCGKAGNVAILVKYNTSGALQWQRYIGTDENGYAVAVDSSNNIYMAGTTKAGQGLNSGFITKWNSSGTLQWQRYLGGTGIENFNGVAVDSSGDIYVAGTTSTTTSGVLIAKYNSSGAIQWQRRFRNTNGSGEAKSITVDSSDNIILIGDITTGSPNYIEAFVLKLPNDGSLTGTYGDFIYESSSVTDAATSLTSGNASLTSSTSTLTSSSVSGTNTTTSLTSSTTYI